MARPVVGNPFDGQIGTVAPTASPVDTYTRGVVKRSPFDALANTLGNLEKKAVPALKREEVRRNEKDFKEGQRLYQENRIAIGEAVKQGIIEEGESPYIRKGYRISQMNTMATRYAAELENALAMDRLHTTSNPERINKYIKNFQAKFVEKNGMSTFSDAEMAEYFGTNAQKYEEQFRSSWQKKHITWQKEQAYAAKQAEVAQVIGTLLQEGMTEQEEDTALVNAANWLRLQGEEANINGQNNKRTNKAIVDGVILAATASGDPEILDILMKTKIGTGYVGKSLDAMKSIYAAKSSIARTNEARSSAAAKAHDAAQEELRGQISAEVFGNIHSDGYNYDFVADRIQRLVATGDEKNVAEAMTLMNYNTKINKLAVEPANLTTKHVTEILGKIENAPTAQIASERLIAFAEANNQDAAFISKYMGEWSKYYEPKSDAVGLNFNTTATTEGRALAAIKDSILGDPDSVDFAKQEYHDTWTRTNILVRDRVRQAVKTYKAANNGEFPSDAEMEMLMYSVNQEIKIHFNQDGGATSKVKSLVNLTSDFGFDVSKFGTTGGTN